MIIFFVVYMLLSIMEVILRILIFGYKYIFICSFLFGLVSLLIKLFIVIYCSKLFRYEIMEKS